MTKLPPQYEDPDDAAKIALWKARLPEHLADGAFVGGAQILNFRKGWAIAILAKSQVAHWYVRGWLPEISSSLCSFDAFTEHLHGPGNYPRCQRCIKVMTRMIRGGLM